MKNYEIVDSFWVDESLHLKAILTTASPCWYLQWNAPGHGKGRQRRQSLKTSSKKEARLRAYAFARELAAGRSPTSNLNRATVGEIITLKISRLQALGRDEQTIGTYQRYYATLTAYLPDGEDELLRNLTTSALEAFEKTLRTTGVQLPAPQDPARPKHKPRALAAKTIREVMKAAKGLILFARKRHLLDHDPCDGYELPAGPSEEVDVFSAAELALILADPDPVLVPLWKFLLHTCLRVGELVWLMKDDVIFDEHGHPCAIHIRAKICPLTGRSWHPKHKLERIVPLSAEAADILVKAMQASTGPWAFHAPATLGAQKGKWTEDRIRDRLDKRLKDSGIDHGYPHVFRHTGATYLANFVPEMTLPLLQKFLGHQDIHTTMRYVHAQAADVAQAMQGVDFGRLINPPQAGISTTTMNAVTSTTGTTVPTANVVNSNEPATTVPPLTNPVIAKNTRRTMLFRPEVRKAG